LTAHLCFLDRNFELRNKRYLNHCSWAPLISSKENKHGHREEHVNCLAVSNVNT